MAASWPHEYSVFTIACHCTQAKNCIIMLSASISLLAAVTLASAKPSSQFTPSGNYTPSSVQCPSNYTFVRPASAGLGAGEAAWRSTRMWQAKCALDVYLKTASIPGLDVDAYIEAVAKDEGNIPVIGLTFSGGGTRAALSGMGLYQGLDGRYSEAVAAKTGGLLQAMTYVTGCKCTSDPCLSEHRRLTR